ncbi:phosphatase PAP2 family protein [Streptomyces marincola]|uniref:Inositol phosphorylceramide synthase n=1 Tax=Streptomyces marincola TaxID=2878388 RepID=A0A1W7CSA3_9ACTN|nr:phosphatase PAP2 family protein [Streptomyces marincola]ARQ67681.1 inositol phosphorylceramide synthase [Streptomyces marincola]
MPRTRAFQRLRTTRAGERPAPAARPPLIRELPLVIALYMAYKFGRRVANGQFQDAYDNAELVWDLERALRLPSEAWIQDLVLNSEPLIRAINVYYATVHFPAIVVFLIWMYWRRPGHYLWVRWVLTWLTAGALVLHLLVPLAPPRLFGTADMIDTGEVYGPAVYDKPEPDSMANQFAAMPSLHVGWAVFIAIALIVSSRGRLRWLWLLHPLITILAVVATAHHYWMDGIVACAILAAVLLVLRPPALPAATGAAVPAGAAGGTPGPAQPPEAGKRDGTAPGARDGTTAGSGGTRVSAGTGDAPSAPAPQDP